MPLEAARASPLRRTSYARPFQACPGILASCDRERRSRDSVPALAQTVVSPQRVVMLAGYALQSSPRAQPLGRADWNGWDAVAVLVGATRPAGDIQQHETSANRAMGSRRRNVRY
jgi:hypothetical protein